MILPTAVLTINSGSSSVKFSLFESHGAELRLLSHGQVENIDSEPHFIACAPSGETLVERRWPQGRQPYEALLRTALEFVDAHLGATTLIGVGHRVVHGGAKHYRPELVTEALLASLEASTPLAPLHLPRNLLPIRATASVRPYLPQVVCFDTAFHHDMPRCAAMLALPREYERFGLRRYGFHGLSYEYIARKLSEARPDLARGRVIVAHLGNGASLCAMRDGRSIDTTMGFSALDGLVMGSRCGSLDPGAILHLEQELGLSVLEVQDVLYRRSGLLGVSGGLSSDMRTLLASADPHAKEAVDLFVFQLVKLIGALAASLDGLDGLIFTAGIGANAPEIRARTCARLAWLGLKLDHGANERNALTISSPESQVEVLVIPTDEEAVIARHVREAMQSSRSPVDMRLRNPHSNA